MASSTDEIAPSSLRGRNLDATAGREVVFCHACSNEWYRDEHGLVCPGCDSDITEIVTPGSDPREAASSSSGSTSPDLPPLRIADDSDPDEADIEEHLGPHGFQFQRTIRFDPRERPPQRGPDAGPIFERFYNMVQNFSEPLRTGPGGIVQLPHRDSDSETTPGVHRTTFSSGPFGGAMASFTIYASPPTHSTRGNDGSDDGSGTGRRANGNPNDPPPSDPFQAIFSNIMRDLPPPLAEDGRRPVHTGFASSLQEILNLFNPASATMGDAVYSQEALDRIITQLMEANPSSNAAPPASAEALRNLSRRQVDTKLLGPEGTVECSICIDEMKEGETAVFLPCNHWFHEDCVVLWLREHNTCPVCRTPIEQSGRSSNQNPRGSNPSGDGGSGPSNETPHSHHPPSFSRHDSDEFRGFGGRYDGGADTPSGRAAADMVSSIYVDARNRQNRLDEVLRSVASMQREREVDQRDRATASGFGYDTSRLQRRTSHSPTSPRTTNFAEQGARMRQRSPSENNRRGNGDREGRRQSGAWNWLRDRFAGSGSSGGN
ncbi:hypothetical protein QQS21_006515 [Conoideocrella luteorostrata]|uniref:RING-type E3 ubiquitin transferase n=1 Tax=Conoideocrella luteorostrata TaxID=1105319 RepID=A0AAJ0CRP9_9HYPO|nr:hypothetical protein QQS21_006515 [Conoideocrella luteorostrata]